MTKAKEYFMDQEVDYHTLPTDYNPEREVLYMKQVDYKLINSISFYTYPTKEGCTGERTTAIFTIKPKKP